MCSYCGCQSISLIGRFMAEHDELVNLSGDLQRAEASGDAAAVEVALDQMVTQLNPHTGAEKAGLFTVLRRNPDFTDHVDQLCGEHASLDELAARIRSGEHGLIHDFVELLRDHMAKEDNGLFPAAAIELDGPDWEEAIELTLTNHNMDSGAPRSPRCWSATHPAAATAPRRARCPGPTHSRALHHHRDEL